MPVSEMHLLWAGQHTKWKVGMKEGRGGRASSLAQKLTDGSRCSTLEMQLTAAEITRCLNPSAHQQRQPKQTAEWQLRRVFEPV